MPDRYTPDDERFLREAKIEPGASAAINCTLYSNTGIVDMRTHEAVIASLEHQQCLLRQALTEMRESRSNWRYWCIALAVALVVMTFWRQP